MATAVVPFGSELKRKAWMREGLVQSSHKSFWSAMTGNTMESVVFQAKNESASEGHTVVFDFDGNLSGGARKGKETAFGTGEQKRKFSDKLTVDRYRLVVDNGDEFDGVDIGSIDLTTHADSRSKLSDLFMRWKDQALFDVAQGLCVTQAGITQAPSHRIDLGTTFNWNTLTDLERQIKTGRGFTSGGVRAPLKPYRTSGGEDVWLFLVDTDMASMLKKDTAGYQNILRSADVRGDNNRLIKGVIGKIGQLYIVEAPVFFGATAGATSGWSFNQFNVEISGLRQYQGANPATAIWSGQEGFDYAGTNIHSRGLLLGAGALQLGFGKQPDYKFQPSEDFGIKSESAVEFWMEAQKTKLKLESGSQYNMAKISEMDFGVIAVDLQVSA